MMKYFNELHLILKQISKVEQVTCKMFYTDYAGINCKTDM